MARSNRSSAYEEEIEVHPSTELIPDEYEHFGNQPKFLVHTFFKDTEADKDNEKDFLKTLSEIGITCKDEDRHNLDQEKIFEILNRIKENCSDDTTGLIMYFSGMVKQHQGILHTKLPSNDISIQKIWLEFNSFNCFKLKNKPKIFIYDLKVYAPPTQRDARRFSVQSLTISAYDTPSEADILVICNKDTEAKKYVEAKLQRSDVNLDDAKNLLQKCLKTVSELRGEFDDVLDQARKLAAKWNIDSSMTSKRKRKVKTFFDELSSDYEFSDPVHCFKFNVFLRAVDILISQLNERFKSMVCITDTFSFLNPDNLLHFSDEQLKLDLFEKGVL
uniref:Uncharacterized protein LOC114327987 n=1 Tax=Diabrotica virgifera virgifera TaxID=50390 RepID=A0A6P7FAE1_DIAVI